MEASGYQTAANLLPPELKSTAVTLPSVLQREAEEIRLRSGYPMSVLLSTGEREFSGGRPVTGADIASVLEIATQSSAHTARAAISNGFVTVRGGCRVGLCGTAVLDAGSISGLRGLSSAAIRIPRQIFGCADAVYANLCASSPSRTIAAKSPQPSAIGPSAAFAVDLPAVLIISPPGGGKTTFLRELVRLYSQSGIRVSLADERAEVAGVWEGLAQFDVGARTDILTGAPKSEAVMLLLRAMNPEIIALDEISAPQDIAAISHAANCGVGIIATAHANDVADLSARPLYRDLKRIFSHVVIIKVTSKGRSYELKELSKS